MVGRLLLRVQMSSLCRLVLEKLNYTELDVDGVTTA